MLMLKKQYFMEMKKNVGSNESDAVSLSTQKPLCKKSFMLEKG